MTWRPLSASNYFDPRPMATIEARCFHCGLATITPLLHVQSEEAKYWQQRYDGLLGQLNGAIQQSHMIHGDDPIRQDFVRSLLKIRKQFEI